MRLLYLLLPIVTSLTYRCENDQILVVQSFGNDTIRMHCNRLDLCGYQQLKCDYEQAQPNCGGQSNFVAKVNQLNPSASVDHTCCNLHNPRSPHSVPTHLGNDCFIYELPDGTTKHDDVISVPTKEGEAPLTVLKSVDDIPRHFDDQDGFKLRLFALRNKTPPVLLVKGIERRPEGYRVTICRPQCSSGTTLARSQLKEGEGWKAISWSSWASQTWTTWARSIYGENEENRKQERTRKRVIPELETDQINRSANRDHLIPQQRESVPSFGYPKDINIHIHTPLARESVGGEGGSKGHPGANAIAQNVITIHGDKVDPTQMSLETLLERLKEITKEKLDGHHPSGTSETSESPDRGKTEKENTSNGSGENSQGAIAAGEVNHRENAGTGEASHNRNDATGVGNGATGVGNHNEEGSNDAENPNETGASNGGNLKEVVDTGKANLKPTSSNTPKDDDNDMLGDADKKAARNKPQPSKTNKKNKSKENGDDETSGKDVDMEDLYENSEEDYYSHERKKESKGKFEKGKLKPMLSGNTGKNKGKTTEKNGKVDESHAKFNVNDRRGEGKAAEVVKGEKEDEKKEESEEEKSRKASDLNEKTEKKAVQGTQGKSDKNKESDEWAGYVRKMIEGDDKPNGKDGRENMENKEKDDKNHPDNNSKHGKDAGGAKDHDSEKKEDGTTQHREGSGENDGKEDGPNRGSGNKFGKVDEGDSSISSLAPNASAHEGRNSGHTDSTTTSKGDGSEDKTVEPKQNGNLLRVGDDDNEGTSEVEEVEGTMNKQKKDGEGGKKKEKHHTTASVEGEMMVSKQTTQKPNREKELKEQDTNKHKQEHAKEEKSPEEETVDTDENENGGDKGNKGKTDGKPARKNSHGKDSQKSAEKENDSKNPNHKPEHNQNGKTSDRSNEDENNGDDTGGKEEDGDNKNDREGSEEDTEEEDNADRKKNITGPTKRDKGKSEGETEGKESGGRKKNMTGPTKKIKSSSGDKTEEENSSGKKKHMTGPVKGRGGKSEEEGGEGGEEENAEEKNAGKKKNMTPPKNGAKAKALKNMLFKSPKGHENEAGEKKTDRDGEEEGEKTKGKANKKPMLFKNSKSTKSDEEKEEGDGGDGRVKGNPEESDLLKHPKDLRKQRQDAKQGEEIWEDDDEGEADDTGKHEDDGGDVENSKEKDDDVNDEEEDEYDGDDYSDVDKEKNKRGNNDGEDDRDTRDEEGDELDEGVEETGEVKRVDGKEDTEDTNEKSFITKDSDEDEGSGSGDGFGDEDDDKFDARPRKQLAEGNSGKNGSSKEDDDSSGEGNNGRRRRGGKGGEGMMDQMMRGGGCFTSDSMVTTPNGQKRMDELRIGDMVLVPSAGNVHKYEMIEMFYHREPETTMTFLSLQTESGKMITLTPRHLIPIGNCDLLTSSLNYSEGVEEIMRKSIFASNGRVGDCVVSRTDDHRLFVDPIAKISRRISKGIYAPMTVEGSIIVDEVLSSCFAEVESHFTQKMLYDFTNFVYRMFSMTSLYSVSSDDVSPIPTLVEVFRSIGHQVVPFMKY